MQHILLEISGIVGLAGPVLSWFRTNIGLMVWVCADDHYIVVVELTMVANHTGHEHTSYMA